MLVFAVAMLSIGPASGFQDSALVLEPALASEQDFAAATIGSVKVLAALGDIGTACTAAHGADRAG